MLILFNGKPQVTAITVKQSPAACRSTKNQWNYCKTPQEVFLGKLMTNTSHSRRLSEHQRTVLRRVQSAASACLGLELREAQIVAATHLLSPCIAEMQTGEGKTLTAVLAAAVLATANRKVLIATANDYLASRDADWMGPIYQRLGAWVGCLTSESTPQQRVDAYDCDIVYGTLREFAFDFLRRSLAGRRQTRGSRRTIRLSMY